MRVLIAAPPYAGHLNPLLPIGRRLQARGDSIMVVTGPARLAQCRSLGFEAVPVLPDDPGAMERTPTLRTGWPATRSGPCARRATT